MIIFSKRGMKRRKDQQGIFLLTTIFLVLLNVKSLRSMRLLLKSPDDHDAGGLTSSPLEVSASTSTTSSSGTSTSSFDEYSSPYSYEAEDNEAVNMPRMRHSREADGAISEARKSANRTAEKTSPDKSGDSEEKIALKALDKLLRSYDRRSTPTNEQGVPTNVSCQLYVASLSSINTENMDYMTDTYLRQKWFDPRFADPDIKTPLDLADPMLVKAIWKPEVFFPNAKEANFQFVTVPNVLIRIHPGGEILYILRLSLKFSCMMELSRYPLDTQICAMQISSFSKTTKELLLEWDKTGAQKAASVAKDLKMPQFEMQKITTNKCHEENHMGNYSCLVAEFHLHRSIGFHLIQSYLPSILIVAISWVSFWMDVDCVPARVTLGVITLLTVSSQVSGNQVPQTSYVKAIDVWMGVCTAFVFAALVEFTLVNYMWRKNAPSNYARRFSTADGVGNVAANKIMMMVGEEAGHLLGGEDDGSSLNGRPPSRLNSALTPCLAPADDEYEEGMEMGSISENGKRDNNMINVYANQAHHRHHHHHHHHNHANDSKSKNNVLANDEGHHRHQRPNSGGYDPSEETFPLRAIDDNSSDNAAAIEEDKHSPNMATTIAVGADGEAPLRVRVASPEIMSPNNESQMMNKDGRCRRQETRVNNVMDKESERERKAREKARKYRNFAAKIDEYCRYIFPIGFVLFNLAYWNYYKEPNQDDVESLKSKLLGYSSKDQDF